MKFYHHFTKRLPAMLPYLRLFRISNIFTVIADTTAAFLLVHGSLSPAGGWLSLMVASCLIYTAGMILNDVFDLEVDQQQRPERPLPSGAIPVTTAKRLGFGFLGLGVLVATLAGFLLTPEGNGLSTLCWAVLLALAVSVRQRACLCAISCAVVFVLVLCARAPFCDTDSKTTALCVCYVASFS